MPVSRKPRTTRTRVPASCVWLARSRDLKHLWIMRMLVHGNALEYFCTRFTSLLAELHLPCSKLLFKNAKFVADLAATLRIMESRASQFRLDEVLRGNLDVFDRQFSLTQAERLTLAWAVSVACNNLLYRVACSTVDSKNPPHQFAEILGLPLEEAEQAQSPHGSLCKTGLIGVSSGGSPDENIKLTLGRFRVLGNRRLDSVEEVFREFLRPGSDTTLTREDFAHLRPDFAFVANVLREALQSQRAGVNILLYGSPGTGKTECARLLCRELAVPLFEVSFIDKDGGALQPMRRLQNAATAQYLMRERQSLLLFDELDAAFNDGSDFTGKPTTAESAKAWVNDLLEKSPNPTIWTANRIDKMDAAFVRRFDLIIPMESPPMRQRERLLEKLCGDMLDASQIRRFGQVRSATPAVVTRAVSIVRRVKCTNRSHAEILETVLDGTLIAQGHAGVRRECQGLPVEDYDLSLCNADVDLNAVVVGLAKGGIGRLCLYGPPGTGKTAFGHWLANALDRPLLLKRASEIQSPFVGVMERNLARAFDEAARDSAVLQIDEVDTFLQDRRGAQRQWEISQTNEFLTQLESFDGVFVASTNLMDGLDHAALRRFDYKIRISYLRPEQSRRMFERLMRDWNLACGDGSLAQVARMTCLTPGDFALVQRRHAIVPFSDARAVLNALEQEVEMKRDQSRSIGFV